jgi:hypothetical protein
MNGMKRRKAFIALFLALSLVAVLMGGCEKSAVEPTGQEPAGQEPPTPSPEPTVNPQADFISGAKEFLSTDLVELLTGEEDGPRLVGLLSDVLTDLNTKTAQTDATLTLSDITFGGSAIDGSGTLSLGALHDAASGDSSLTVSLGMGTDVAKNVGIYINGDTAVLKPGSASEKIMLYTMPQVDGASNTFLDRRRFF